MESQNTIPLSPYRIHVPAFDSARIDADRDGWIDIGTGIGFPLGGLGTGYNVLGRYGFLRENFDSAPDAPEALYPRAHESYRLYHHNPALGCDYALTVAVDGETFVLSEVVPAWFEYQEAKPVASVAARVKMPEGRLEYGELAGVAVAIRAFAPLIPGDLDASSTPAEVLDIHMCNHGAAPKEIRLRLRHRYTLYPAEAAVERTLVGQEFELADDGVCSGIAVTLDRHGQTAFALEGAPFASRGPELSLRLAPGEEMTRRLVIAWHYPNFKTPSPAATGHYRRRYAALFPSAAVAAQTALRDADGWLARIREFHAKFDFPGAFQRIWFGSLASLVTSSMLADTGEYFEIETPHYWVNTMDVSVYSSWAVMLLYPELERVDMRQFVAVIPRDGARAGFVWHSLWHDACHYAEEPTFLVRYCRDFFFYRDREGARRDWDLLTLILEKKLDECTPDGLIDSESGNQSYDAWKMPGIGMYVNTPWIYALAAYARMARELGLDGLLHGVPAEERAHRAAAALDRLLWNDRTGCWNCFSGHRPSSNRPDTVFSDQLFGRWVLAIVAGCEELLPPDRSRRSLETIYRNNLLTRPEAFRGWANGMRPGGAPELCSYHAKTCWLGAQLDFAALLGLYGMEPEALDVYASIEFSLQNNHLAVGEWNCAANEAHEPILLAEEPGKDTGRFPPYPRYKSAWESLVRLLGVTLDLETMYLNPFRTVSFHLREFPVAGELLEVRVEAGWSHCCVNGVPVEPGRVALKRGANTPYRIEFSV